MHELVAFLWCLFWFAVCPEHIDLCFCIGFFYMGREHAQAEYRYIEAHGGCRAKCPPWCGFLPSAWTSKSILDWLAPLVVCALFPFIKMVQKSWM